MKPDIQTRADVELLVNTFYDKVKQDDLLGPIFGEIMHVNWDVHLPKMYDFWEFILFQKGNYKGQPFPPHLRVNEINPLSTGHFDRWLKLFYETADFLFEGPKTLELKEKSNNIKQVWAYKINHINAQRTI